MEIVTGPLTNAALLEEVDDIASILVKLGHENIKLVLGSGCNCSSPEYTSGVQIATATLTPHLLRLENEGSIRIGRSEATFSTLDVEVHFLICELSEIHCVTSEADILSYLTASWLDGYPKSHELNRATRQLRLLSENIWQPYAEIIF